jgi:hypothetical protein
VPGLRIAEHDAEQRPLLQREAAIGHHGGQRCRYGVAATPLRALDDGSQPPHNV